MANGMAQKMAAARVRVGCRRCRGRELLVGGAWRERGRRQRGGRCKCSGKCERGAGGPPLCGVGERIEAFRVSCGEVRRVLLFQSQEDAGRDVQRERLKV